MFDEQFQRAEEAEATDDFAEAYRLFLLLADAHEQSGDLERAQNALFRAGTCLERSQQYRALASVWRRVGDLVGRGISEELDLGHSFVRRVSPGQSSTFNVISHEQWADPYEGYYDDHPVAAARHRQAWAYAWGASGAEMQGLLRSSARYHRLSALCWELGKHGGLGEVGEVRAELGRTELSPEQGPGLKWRLAARHYGRAAYMSALAPEPAERDWLEKPWKPDSLGWSLRKPDGRELAEEQTRWAKEQQDLQKDAWEAQSDLDRMGRCWREAVAVEPASETEAFTQHAQQLELVQHALARSGRGAEARKVYLRRDRLLTDDDDSIPAARRLLRRADHVLTRRGTSLPRLLLVAAVLYLLVLPAAFLGFSLIAAKGGGVNIMDGELFSVANVVGVSVGDLTGNGVGGQVLQVLESLSAFVVLGVAIWMYTRSYEGV